MWFLINSEVSVKLAEVSNFCYLDFELCPKDKPADLFEFC